jgi:hypothetical protein
MEQAVNNHLPGKLRNNIERIPPDRGGDPLSVIGESDRFSLTVLVDEMNQDILQNYRVTASVLYEQKQRYRSSRLDTDRRIEENFRPFHENQAGYEPRPVMDLGIGKNWKKNV